MGGLELNKIAASVLLAGLIAMISGNLADILYKPSHLHEKRGFSVEVVEPVSTTSNEPVKEVTFDVKVLMANANAEKGANLSKKCSACHSFEKNGPNRVGPHLWGVLEREKASIANYSYSQAFKDQKGKWDYSDLFKYLYDPKNAIPGNKMGFIGLKKPEDIANMVAYLRSLSDSPTPLP